jgi:ATP-dependent Clp protease ATP-binding subunit ClpC
MFERFTDRARRVVVLAQEESRLFNHDYIGTEHILLGLIHEGEGVAATALESLGISLDSVRSEVEEMIGHGKSPARGHIPFTPRAKKVLELSLREALQLGHTYIGTEHILLGLIREGQGVAAQVLQKLGADLDRVRQQVIDALSGSEVSPLERERSEGRRFFGLLSESAESLLKAASWSADDLGHGAIEPVDILLALTATDDDLVRELLATWGIDLDAVRRRIEELAAEEEGADPGD